MPIFPPAPDPLFTQRNLTTLLKDQIHKMENAIDELSDDVFLQNSPDDMSEAISQDAYLPPIELHADKGISHPPIEISNTIVNQSGVPINGFRYSIEVPYNGASGLFNHQPETYDLDKPTAQLNSHSMRGSILINRIATAEVAPEELKAAFDAELDKVRRYIGYQAVQIDPFNASLKTEAARIVHGRRDRLLKARQVAASLGYPLHHRPGAPLTYVSPMVRRQIKTTVTGSFQPEPTIEEAEYQNILRIIENMSFVMERNPKVFSTAPEETIRDHYLVQLNGQYEGSATGETFNGEGKTDILVRDGSANVFIAECKVWHGQKQFIEAIDQLLGYVTWRVTKTAIIIFNRDYIPRDLGHGLTCATFVMAMFETQSLRVLKAEEWPTADLEDSGWQARMAAQIGHQRGGIIGSAIAKYVGHPRFKPEQVAAGAIDRGRPLGREPAQG